MDSRSTAQISNPGSDLSLRFHCWYNSVSIFNCSSQAPQKRPLQVSSSIHQPAKQRRITLARTPQSPSQIPATVSTPPTKQPIPATVSTPPTKKLTLKPVSLKKTKRSHKRIQVDEHQTEALDSGDEFEPKYVQTVTKKTTIQSENRIFEHFFRINSIFFFHISWDKDRSF